MGDPVIVERAAHSLSRSQIDPDALKVLYRLHQNSYVAYLVGGSVRDLLLGRRPKDFDIGTSAHPYQVKRLFKNCWIIGRRFRLAHVRFGTKTVEVATFRRKITAEELAAAEAVPDPPETAADGQSPDRLIHRENTFGTPEEDAFRRDFTINALFYDIGTFSIIDYTGGLEDLASGRRSFDRRSRGTLPRGPRPDAAGDRHGRPARVHDRSADRCRDRGEPR